MYFLYCGRISEPIDAKNRLEAGHFYHMTLPEKIASCWDSVLIIAEIATTTGY